MRRDTTGRKSEARAARRDGDLAMGFARSEPLTLGLELELQLVSAETGRLAPSASALYEELTQTAAAGRFALEATQATMELNSSVHTDAGALLDEVRQLAAQLLAVAGPRGVLVRGGGTHIAQFWNERVLTPSPRAQVLEARFGFLPRRFSTYGMHVHVGMPDAEAAIRVANVLQALCPLLIAVSAASPFLQHMDSRMAACRPLEPLVYPHGGPMPPLRDWAHLQAIVQEYADTGIAETLKDIYWDVRPKPEFGTVEVRVFDTPLTIDKAVSMAALTRGAAALALVGRLGVPDPIAFHTEARVSRFLACRDGMSARLFNPWRGGWQPAQAWLADLLQMLREQARLARVDGGLLDEAICAQLSGDLSAIERLPGAEDHALMRTAWNRLSLRADGSAPETSALVRYSTELAALLLEPAAA